MRRSLIQIDSYPLTQKISKLVYTLFTDIEATFLGFSEACASAGKDGCKLLTLLHEDATGKEVKRFIEDAHDVRNQPGISSSTNAIISWPLRYG